MSTRNSVVSLSSSSSTKVETHLIELPSQTSLFSHGSGQEGPMIPSNSSKDDDLSSSSIEIENMAMRALENLEESNTSTLIRQPEYGDIRIDGRGKTEKTEKSMEVRANIQNEFGVCGWILTILSYLLIFVTLPISACMCIKVVQEYERAVIFRLGRLMPGGAKGPGIFFIVPCIDTYRKVDLRVLSFEVPPQEILSKDSVTVAVDAVVYFRISNATISVTNVEDAARSTKLLAQTTLRNILGTKTLAEMLSDREAISHQMQNTLDEATEPWGVKVERVEVKDVRLPVQLQRAMAAEAEAAREARAKVIVAEGEQKASRALKEAAEVIAESPSALQLRYLQTLNSISCSSLNYTYKLLEVVLAYEKGICCVWKNEKNRSPLEVITRHVLFACKFHPAKTFISDREDADNEQLSSEAFVAVYAQHPFSQIKSSPLIVGIA
ncbi:hypothetical protein RB195_022937 [Necator americanus]|uniref:Band 7 domain-containing protein n=2 Tax=Necator americanus TaxID=51031 RepID=A0ABR1EI29_NECAM